MSFRVNTMIIAAVLCLFSTGCGTKDKMYLEQAVTETAVSETQEAAPEADSASGEPAAEEKSVPEQNGTCYVYLCGAVAAPGVYEVPAGSRIYEVIQLAGGLTAEASASLVNQAEAVYDGQMIFLPTVEEAAAGIGTDGPGDSGGSGEPAETDTRVNLNTAECEELMTLPGIGQAKAEDILAYRKECGGFSAIEDIMNVAGIKEGLYNRIKEHIRVK